MEAQLAEERMRLEALKSEHDNAQKQDSKDMSAALVKQMGQMLKEAIEKSTKKSTQVETAMNNGSEMMVDTKDMFKCMTCSYINASIRLVCHNCGSKRFSDLRNEKERKHIRKQWVNSLVNMYVVVRRACCCSCCSCCSCWRRRWPWFGGAQTVTFLGAGGHPSQRSTATLVVCLRLLPLSEAIAPQLTTLTAAR
jgi:hypothetical protein